jgi:hypothetical protein
MPFKRKQEVVCINTQPMPGSTVVPRAITMDKKYVVLQAGDLGPTEMIQIVDDQGTKSWHQAERFQKG